MTAIGTSTNKSSKLGLSDMQSRANIKKNEYEQSECGNETVKDNMTAKQGVLSEAVETNSFNSAGFKSGFTGGASSCFKDRQSDA